MEEVEIKDDLAFINANYGYSTYLIEKPEGKIMTL